VDPERVERVRERVAAREDPPPLAVSARWKLKNAETYGRQ